MKLRAHPIVRLGVALSGLIYLALGLHWATTVLKVENGHIWPEPPDMAAAAVISVVIVSAPLVAVGVLTLARAAFLGVTCNDTEVKVHKMLWTRRVPAQRLVEVRRTWTGKTDLWWKGDKGWPRWTRIPAFSLSLLTRPYARQWVEPYNEQCVGTLRRWIEERRPA
ncbi:hypothetical protein [Nonomuraea zeae]|uniref:Uncharacterized protein n=1 Tax=Nonomuraea zeae TaxID=1642303 RepID=A0A5S4FLD6_9ACTN|nr:hypothetical protein [Nonomuraea zeae]TMR21538.1 hypothetical protein ETD85_50765 [Nonomuraea zeae]